MVIRNFQLLEQSLQNWILQRNRRSSNMSVLRNKLFQSLTQYSLTSLHIRHNNCVTEEFLQVDYILYFKNDTLKWYHTHKTY